MALKIRLFEARAIFEKGFCTESCRRSFIVVALLDRCDEYQIMKKMFGRNFLIDLGSCGVTASMRMPDGGDSRPGVAEYLPLHHVYILI